MRKMKDSGIEWINQVPFDWEVKKLKYCFTFSKGLSITKDNLEESGIPVISYGQIHSKLNTGTSVNDSLIRYVNESYLRTDKSALVKKNDFIFADTSEDLEGCGNCIYNDFNGNLFAGYHTIIFRSQQSNAKYFAYLFLTDCWRSQIRKVASGVKLYSITQKILKETSIIIPPLPEQKKIANFLDAKCADIDQIRADIEKQIEILTDYKKSVITEAVTKGLDPKVKMKDSGIKWIGKIPEHWEVQKGKYVLKYLQKTIKEDDGVITCFRDGEVTLRSNRREDGFTISEKEIGYQGIDVGDLVVHGMDGFAGSIGISDSRGKASPVLNVLDSSQNKRYLMYYLRSMAYNNVFVALATGIRVRSCDLRWNKLAELPYPLPPIAEQNRIADYIENTLKQTGEILTEKQKQLETLEEYKKSLIFEYVTGKKEVV